MRFVLSRPFIAVLTLIAALAFAATFVHAVYYAPDGSTYAPSTRGAASAAPIGDSPLPERLLIPKFHIDAPVRAVGLRKDGSMGVPSNFTDVAWYKYGTVPGNTGSAVIDGHVDNALSLPGVFKNLAMLAPGDDIYVGTASSSTVHFVVTDVEEYAFADVPLDRIFNASDGSYLNLITCDGTWDQAADMYDHRLVVYAKRAP